LFKIIPDSVGWGVNPNMAIHVHEGVGVCTPTYVNRLW
jgi:hypothetical protein